MNITKENKKSKGKKIMGMSASQARFLSLTARKTNVEFEGQQINQQRTTLSNQSAGYYSQLTNLTVPTPPSTQDYSRITYTFEDGTEVNTINQLIATKEEASGKIIYLVNYTQSVLEDNVVSNGSVIVNRSNAEIEDGKTYTGIDGTTGLPTLYAAKVPINGEDKWIETTVGTTPLRKLCSISYDPDSTIQTAEDKQIASNEHTYLATLKANEDYYLKSVSQDDLASVQELEATYLAKLREKYNDGKPVDYYVRYQQDSNTGKWTPIFYDEYQVLNAHYNDTTGNSISSVKSYIWGQSTETNEVKNVKARVEQDASGRYTAISIYGFKEDGKTIDESRVTTYKLNATNTTDDDAYNDAMNKYAYDKSRYDKTIQDINSKIQIIQEQDKNLELKLKQLDTEQNAISTEIDAVKKVIQKNVESSFKTFSA